MAFEPEVVVYPRAPLRAVAIEVSFDALVDAMPRFGQFQRRHRGDFAHLYETSGEDAEWGRLPKEREFNRPRTAVLMGKDRAVSIARDQLAVITYAYDAGFEDFSAWAIPLLQEGLADLDVREIRTVRFRYENRIERKAGTTLGSVLKISLPPQEGTAAVQHAHLAWDHPRADGTVFVEVEACPYMGPEEIHFNITAKAHAVSGDTGSLVGLDERVRRAHRMARLTFEELISDVFREQLGPARAAQRGSHA